MPQSPRKRFARPFLWVTFALLVVLVGGDFEMRRLLNDPRVVLLQSQNGAQWLRVNQTFDSSPKTGISTAAMFREEITVPSNTSAVIQVTALRRVVVSIDGKSIFDSGPDLENWKTIRNVRVDLSAGEHKLIFAVTNRDGPSLLRVLCPALDLHTDDKWLASKDGIDWSPAMPVDREWYAPLPPSFESAPKSLLRYSPLLICVFLIGGAAMSRRPTGADWGKRVRWILLLAWCVLAANNISKVPLEFGYDADEHTRYIQYVADHLSLPRPDAGWQFFQSPLYYIVSAALDRLLILLGVAASTVPYLLRLIPLVCGAALIEISYRAARSVFPDRFDLQAIATTVGGLLPVNIYMAQAVSNEPMGAAVSGIIILLTLRLLVQPQAIQSKWHLIKIGFALGIAWLTKINTIIWIVPLGFAMGAAFYRKPHHLRGNASEKNSSFSGFPEGTLFEDSKSVPLGQPLNEKSEKGGPASFLRPVGIVIGVALLICSWYGIRNIWLIGRPFYLESSVARSQWWQDPGYRTPKMFYEFGHVFARPIYNGLSSVWDCLYSTMWGDGIVAGQPDWNFGLMSCGLWLSVLPMLAIGIGIWQAIIRRNLSLVFSTLAIGCFTGAIVYVYLTLPIYSCGKASYMLGTAPCIGLLAAAGFDVLMQNKKLRIVGGGLLICWAVTAYLTFFVM